MDLEKLATSAVEDSISQTETMSPFISDGDKEPVWDGHIYIYSDKSKRKENIKKIPVQIKGKKSNKMDDVIKYSLDISYLNDYLDDGGVFFFVVYIGSSGRKKQIYYASLLPVKLRILLSGLKEKQKTKTFELKKFPEDNSKKTMILLNFYENMKKQTSFRHAELLSQEELYRQGKLESISFSVTGFGKRPADIRDWIFEVDDLYMYANIKGSAIPQPLEQIPLAIHMSEDINQSVSVGGTKYYNGFHRIKSKGALKIIIGKSVHLRMVENSTTAKIDFKPTTILEDALIDIPFILSIIEKQHVQIAGISINLDEIASVFTPERIKELQSNLAYYQKLEKLFNTLRLDKSKDISKFSVEDHKTSARLIDAFLHGKAVKGLKKDMPHVALIKYSDTKLALIFKQTETSGTYEISDFFADNSYELFRIGEEGEHLPTSKYVNLTAENFLEIGNVDYANIIDSFQYYSDEYYCTEEATLLLLQMILAFDMSQDKRMDILTHAEEMAKWLVKIESEYSDPAIMKLNLFQIQKRKRQLTENEENELVEIAETTYVGFEEQTIMHKIGAYLLLDNQPLAKYWFNKLDNEMQDQFRKYPIWRFCKFESTDS